MVVLRPGLLDLKAQTSAPATVSISMRNTQVILIMSYTFIFHVTWGQQAADNSSWKGMEDRELRMLLRIPCTW